ncbi:MAG TPA: cytochrome c [Bryobacteraceae bacterium]|nr:cytochrome c [Bryobacteraceae bacterium]
MRRCGILLVAAAVASGAWAMIAQEARSVWDGVFTEGQSDRGKALYTRECASCHGDTLGGGESAPPLVGDGFLSNWNGLTVGDLYDRIRVSMPQDNPGRLSRQQDADVVAYLLAFNQFPPGKIELDTHSEVLKQIQIKPK